MNDLIKRIKENYKSPFVARDRLAEVTGGVINPRTMRNRDCQGTGIRGRFKIGRKVAYPIEEVINWLIENSAEIQGGQNDRTC